MKTTWRSALVLGGTLLLGAAIGLLAGGRLQERRLDAVGGLIRPDRLPRMLESAIGPLAPGQEAELRQRLETIGAALHQRMQAHRLEMRAYADSLLESLRPELSEEQWNALRERLGDLERRFDRPPPPGFGPGPGGRPDGPGPGPGRGRHRPPPPPPGE